MSKPFGLHLVTGANHTFLKNNTFGQVSATVFQLGIKGEYDKFSIQGTAGTGPIKNTDAQIPALQEPSALFSGNITSHYQINNKYGVSLNLDSKSFKKEWDNYSRERIDDGQEVMDYNAYINYICDTYHITPEDLGPLLFSDIESLDLDNNPVAVETYNEKIENSKRKSTLVSIGAEVDRTVKNFNFGLGLEGRWMKCNDSKTDIDRTYKTSLMHSRVERLSCQKQYDENEHRVFSMTPTARVSYNVPFFNGHSNLGLNLEAKIDQVKFGIDATF